MKILRKLWHLLAHARDPLNTRWTPRENGTFERHCARCEGGWSCPLGLGVLDVVDTDVPMPKRYRGPVELRDGRWQPLRASAPR